MESVIAHEIEQEIAAPPPRIARLPWRTQALLVLAGALAVLLLLGGVRALLEVVRLGWVSAAGRTVTAHVTEVNTVPPSAPGQPAMPISLRYDYADPFDGTAVRRFARIGADSSREGGGAMPGMGGRAQGKIPVVPVIHIGDGLPLRVAHWRGRPVEYFWRPAPYGKALFLTLCGLVVIGVSLHLIRTLAHWRRQRTRLLGHGVAAIGTIIHKHADVNDTPRYYLRYGYATVQAGETLEHEEQVSREQWGRFEIGQPVTVLYDPDVPPQAGLYGLMRN